MNSKVMLTIFILAINFNLIFGQISCNYNVTVFGYTCDLVINNPNGLNNFASIGGVHVPGHLDSDVIRIMTTSGSISTNIPSIICSKFKNIQWMYLQSIGIRRIDDYSFIDCTAMRLLDFRFNEISFVHEKAFNRNLNLLYLYFHNNQLTTLPENVFQNLQRLEILWFDYNNIADLPPKIFRPLTSLNSLDFKSNQLRSIRPEWFELLPSMKYLYMASNFIADIPKNAFVNLKNLDSFSVASNNIKMIHADSFGFLPNLKYINVDNNQVNAVDENLIDYTGVSRVNMLGNFCANKDISDSSISRDYMRAEMRECFNNYERSMSGKLLAKLNQIFV